MAVLAAYLVVDGHSFPLLGCSFGTRQRTDQRGRVNTKVRYEPVQLSLDVPDSDLLMVWAATAHKRLLAYIVFLDADGGSPLETLRLAAAYCVGYQEEFVDSAARQGAYVCHLTLADPDGFTLKAGGPDGGFAAPAARDHGTATAAVVVSAVAAAAATSLPIPPHLPAPQPQPSPDHQQVHLTQQEWERLIKGRWDDSEKAKSKRFLKKHRNTEFHVAGDPFTYRTNATGRVEAVYDAQKSYNVTGSKKGLMGIPLTLNGQPTYAGTPHLMPVTGSQKNVVEIKMAGNRSGDFKQANEEAGLADLVKLQGLDANEAPLGYTWHHRDNFNPKDPPNPPYGTCTMELVKVKAHRDTFVHYGSCDQCNKYNKQKLYK